MNASLQRERGKGMHHISKSVFICDKLKLQIRVQRPKIYQKNMFTCLSVRWVFRLQRNTEIFPQPLLR